MKYLDLKEKYCMTLSGAITLFSLLRFCAAHLFITEAYSIVTFCIKLNIQLEMKLFSCTRNCLFERKT
uniref:Putative secreted protein n=1 Tax=Lutzomyia longipalpis TaxID=7200 RepID=A0A7G3AMA9_LUTLO